MAGGRKISVRNFTFLAMAALLLAGCASLDSSDTMKLAAPLREGILAGDLGTELPDKVKKRAADAEYKALEGGQTGAPVNWKVAEVQGTVVPQQPYSVGSTNCRRYTHTITQDGIARSATGTACRRDGLWRPLS
jgi:surface antigen